MDRAVRLPGLRALDRNFDRLPESLRWLVERVVHDPGTGAAPKPQLPDPLRARLTALLADDGAAWSRSRAVGSAGERAVARAQYDLALPVEPRVSRWGDTSAEWQAGRGHVKQSAGPTPRR